jgi:hypothetical protein
LTIAADTVVTVASGRLDGLRPSAPPGHARLVESSPHRSLSPPGLLGQLPQRPAALVLGSYELDQPPSLSRCLAHGRGAAELRQHLKYWPGWIRHDAILRETRRSPKALALPSGEGEVPPRGSPGEESARPAMIIRSGGNDSAVTSGGY